MSLCHDCSAASAESLVPKGGHCGLTDCENELAWCGCRSRKDEYDMARDCFSGERLEVMRTVVVEEEL